MELTGARILVTGATGLLGGRVVDHLVTRSDVTVRLLVRNVSKLDRFEGQVLETVIGDITDPISVQRAVHDCDVIIHSVMAKGNSDARSVNVEGTRHILEAALRMGVCRVVHVSSSIVYSPWPDGVVDETFPRVPDGTGTSYHDTKLESEELALGYHRQYGLSVVVVQPVAVYGPRAQAWTLDVLGQLVQNTVLLVGGATAYHNFVYVDDVASGLVLAAEADSVSGESYLIGGSEKILIRDFYARYEQMLGVQSAVIVSRRESEGRVDLGSLYRERGLSMEKPPLIAGTFTTSTYFSIEKARRSLGYEPRFSFDRGMELTRQWAWEQGLCGDRSRAT